MVILVKNAWFQIVLNLINLKSTLATKIEKRNIFIWHLSQVTIPNQLKKQHFFFVKIIRFEFSTKCFKKTCKVDVVNFDML